MKIDTIIIILLIIIIIILIYYYNFIQNVCNKSLEVFYYNNNNNNKTILMLGGIHGNEPAGSVAIHNLMNSLNKKEQTLNNINLILIPNINYCALKMYLRYIPLIGDMNRKFPTEKNYNITKLNPIIKQLLDLINKADFILDFHEGWGYHKLNKASIGSTITPTNTEKSNELALVLLNNINKTIDDPNKKFIILTDNSNLVDNNNYSLNTEIRTSLIYYANIINKDYILIETTGQNNIQPLDVRTSQNKIFIDSIINYYSNN